MAPWRNFPPLPATVTIPSEGGWISDLKGSLGYSVPLLRADSTLTIELPPSHMDLSLSYTSTGRLHRNTRLVGNMPGLLVYSIGFVLCLCVCPSLWGFDREKSTMPAHNISIYCYFAYTCTVYKGNNLMAVRGVYHLFESVKATVYREFMSLGLTSWHISVSTSDRRVSVGNPLRASNRSNRSRGSLFRKITVCVWNKVTVLEPSESVATFVDALRNSVVHVRILTLLYVNTAS
jgi:hypothetical protein